MKYLFMHNPVPVGQGHPGSRLCSQKGVWIDEDFIREKTNKTKQHTHTQNLPHL